MSESKSRVYAHIHKFLQKHPTVSQNTGECCINTSVLTTTLRISTEFICYDDGCLLCKYARNKTQQVVTPTPQHLAAIEIVVDKTHMSGHMDKWCQIHSDPKLF